MILYCRMHEVYTSTCCFITSASSGQGLAFRGGPVEEGRWWPVVVRGQLLLVLFRLFRGRIFYIDDLLRHRFPCGSWRRRFP